ncbi:MAG: glycosyltransferase family 2 protein [Syntrophales bacterium]|nr:glycosyltransferase family 2 protein [Syntrophales bacterium]
MITAVIPFSTTESFAVNCRLFSGLPGIERILVVHSGAFRPSDAMLSGIEAGSYLSGPAWNRIIEEAGTDYILAVLDCSRIDLPPASLVRLVETAELTGAGLVFSDYHEIVKGQRKERPLIDYREGSIRDGFDFGKMVLIRTETAKSSLARHGAIPDGRHCGFYDLRLKIAADRLPYHAEEALYTAAGNGGMTDRETHFSYVDPSNREVQEEMERAATEHLRRIGAWLEPSFQPVPADDSAYPVEASVIIPVRNRARTIAEAVKSALGQKTEFPFNVIVVDNYSSDGTTAILDGLVKKNRRLVHLIPGRFDLGIGGCWNEAVFSEHCGRHAVQLDSDDLYSSDNSLSELVNAFPAGDCGMVIGSYLLVDGAMNEIPPGLIDHREWTDENGRNNALRVNGLGAPRAFRTCLLRERGFLNVSYGEDYEMGLRLSRRYRVGRIYENLYLCRRWEGNTDADLTTATKNRYDLFKDNIRTLEIAARREMNKGHG